MPNQKFPLLLMLMHVLLAQAGVAMPDAKTGDLCDHAARRAALSEGVPLDVLRAISRVETGRRLDGRLQPWPWTINVGGQGYWFKSEVEAKAYAFNIFKSGTRSLMSAVFRSIIAGTAKPSVRSTRCSIQMRTQPTPPVS